MMQPISVVTGGAGFIGSHLVDLLLEEGHKVRVIDNLSGGHETNLSQHQSNPNLEFFSEDILNLEINSEIFDSAKYVFHLAGIGDIVPSIEKPADYLNINVQGTVKVLECSRRAGIEKFVYAASSSCYGLAETPTAEDAPIKPLYPYALSKYMGEQVAFHWGKVYGLPVNAVCIFNAYGPRVRTTGAYGAVFGVFLKQKLAGKPYTVVGNGTQLRDFVYVTDVARAFYLAAKTNMNGERFNLGGGNPQSINALIEILEGPVVYLPKRPSEPDITYADISKIQSMIGWKPMVSFNEGVHSMVQHISDWENAPLWDLDSIATATKSWFRFLDN
jgi:UDP-glucose 4-epimerase